MLQYNYSFRYVIKVLKTRGLVTRDQLQLMIQSLEMDNQDELVYDRTNESMNLVEARVERTQLVLLTLDQCSYTDTMVVSGNQWVEDGCNKGNNIIFGVTRRARKSESEGLVFLFFSLSPFFHPSFIRFLSSLLANICSVVWLLFSPAHAHSN